MSLRKLFNFDFFLNLHLIFKPGHIVPDFQVERLIDLTGILQNHPVEGIIFDIDQTILPFGSDEVSAENREFLRHLQTEYRCCILSNFPPLAERIKRIESIEKQVGIEVIAAAQKKPAAAAFQTALDYLQTEPQKTLMVGDRILTDITGGKNAGLKTVLIPPIDKSTDPFFTVRFPRYFEDKYLKTLQLCYPFKKRLK
ncbi:MAG TPA: YqeG family HAD IIIA-type phosphatase [Bacteroidetes bacterium]|nr:YqeG family HAD IIIA-type phosphatase [Bacteroidota bacterium]